MRVSTYESERKKMLLTTSLFFVLQGSISNFHIFFFIPLLSIPCEQFKCLRYRMRVGICESEMNDH